MMKALVSIISPAYNSTNYISRLLESLENQTYKNIQLIVVDDGSTDHLEKVIEYYQKRNKIKKIDMIRKENGGAASAVKEGLKIVEGKYFMNLDTDDWLEPTAIEKMVNFLENNPNYGSVRINGSKINESTLKKVGYFYSEFDSRTEIFDDLLLENNIVFIGYLINYQNFLKLVPGGKIFSSKAGQNWQLLLPIAQAYPCGYISEPIYNYLIRKDGHSRREKTLEENFSKLKEHRKIIEETIKSLNIDHEKYSKVLDEKYLKSEFKYSFRIGNKKDCNKAYRSLKERNLVSLPYFIANLIACFHLNGIVSRIYMWVMQ